MSLGNKIIGQPNTAIKVNLPRGAYFGCEVFTSGKSPYRKSLGLLTAFQPLRRLLRFSFQKSFPVFQFCSFK